MVNGPSPDLAIQSEDRLGVAGDLGYVVSSAVNAVGSLCGQLQASAPRYIFTAVPGIPEIVEGEMAVARWR